MTPHLSRSAQRRRPLAVYWWAPGRSWKTGARYVMENGRAILYMHRAGARGLSNFGDQLSPLIVEQVTGRRVTWAPPARADLFGIGSILELTATNPDALIWGTGSRLGEPLNASPTRERILAVRGPKTLSLLGNWDIPLGDPGLLVGSRVRPGAPRSGVVLIPHFSSFNRSSDLAILRQARAWGWRVVTPAQPPDEVLTSVAGADVVVSASLHGIVAAHALGIPSILTTFDGSSESMFKYEDHYSMLGLRPHPIPMRELGPQQLRVILESAAAEVELLTDPVRDAAQALTTAVERSV